MEKKPPKEDCGCGGSTSKKYKDSQAVREAQQNQVSSSEYQKAVARQQNARRTG